MVVFSLLLGIVRNLSTFPALLGVFDSGVDVAQVQEYLGSAEPRAVCTRGWRRTSGVGRRTAGWQACGQHGTFMVRERTRGRLAGWRAAGAGGERRVGRLCAPLGRLVVRYQHLGSSVCV